ncbi:MAG: protein arginine kinase [Kiritimatiellia bacterium]
MQAADRRLTVERMAKRPAFWAGVDRDAEVVISSRVRLARNVRGVPFPAWADDKERLRLSGMLRDALARVSPLRQAIFLDMDGLDPVDKNVLLERHLISREMLEKGVGSGVVVSSDERIAVMINEEDHLRLQAINPGMNLLSSWQQVDAVDTELEQFLEYAYDPTLGYLTACPSNLGTGLRASVMLHLAGLRLMEEMDAVIRGLNKLGVAVRGLHGEGSDAHGNVFQISNQSTLGVSEEQIVSRLGEIAQEVAQHERNARARLLESRRIFLLDQLSRTLGIVRYARILSSEETLGLLSGLRLGLALHLVRGITPSEINEIMLLTQPGHLQKIMGRTLAPEQRDIMRAFLVKNRIEGVTLTA